MKLVAIARAPERPDEAAKALAGAAGPTLAEARMRLAPEPPALLARLEAGRADAPVSALRTSGLAALSVDAQVPSDRDRLVAARFALSEAGAVFTPRLGEAMAVAWTDVLAILRGLRAARQETERTEKSKRFSAAAAIATSGLVMTRRAQKTVRSSEESIEHVILVYARDGRAVTLAEGGIDYSCLGPGLKPSSASRSQTAAMVTRRTDTSGSLGVLAEVIRQALIEGLLPWSECTVCADRLPCR